VKRLLTAVAVLSIVLFTLSELPAAQAHVSVIKTVPQYQSTIEQLPSQITITFNSPLIVLGSKNPNTITVLSPNKKSITLQDATVEGAVISVPLDTRNPVAGTYSVHYRVVSTDGHGVSGSYSFELSSGEQAQPLPAPTTDQEHGFWHLHLTHVLQGAGALLGIGAWALYRFRFAPRK
jgi:methionine-rich copper-binding protein CopC